MTGRPRLPAEEPDAEARPTLSEGKRAAIRKAYGALVNLTGGQMRQLWRRAHAPLAPAPQPPLAEEWLETLAGLQRKRTPELDEDDHRLMARAVLEIRRRLARRPGGNIEHSAWRTQLMLLGHDPVHRAL